MVKTDPLESPDGLKQALNSVLFVCMRCLSVFREHRCPFEDES